MRFPTLKKLRRSATTGHISGGILTVEDEPVKGDVPWTKVNRPDTVSQYPIDLHEAIAICAIRHGVTETIRRLQA